MNRIEERFKILRRHEQKAFIAFITAGYPNLAVTEKLILEFSRINVDIIELGVPFSDPLADGPTIQQASEAALKNKVNLDLVLRLVKKIRKKVNTPICIMTYYNPVFCFGEVRLTRMARQGGVDGIIVPDLPPEEAGSLIRLSKANNLDLIFFLSPTSSRNRIKYISKASRGFIYYVSLTGVTGARERLPLDLIKNLKIIKKFAKLPVCVGFGVSSRQQIRQIYKFADGVIVGSAIIEKIRENVNHPDLVKRTADFVSYLKDV